jgi:hypothetical protein
MLQHGKGYYETIHHFTRPYEFVRRLHENSLRQWVGLAQMPGKFATEEDASPSDMAACAQYLEYNIEAYGKQPWSSFCGSIDSTS